MDIYQGHIGVKKMVAYIMLKFIMHWKLKERINLLLHISLPIHRA